ncbi:MAG: hypothetical protein ACD_11C00027G0006 [uncultured bacterium]|nr:MAG: hypothetical protein ACD_11C00027G0006 [uncultured bacterium]HBR72069.1 hypothetical protein [Candidatus Moranbacteria bacterium]
MHKTRIVGKKRTPDGMFAKQWRVNLLAFFVFLMTLVILGRLFTLQIIDRDTYRALADNQHKVTDKIEAQRGEVFLQDDDGLYPLAVNKQFQMAYAVPKELEDREGAALKLADALGLDKEILKQKFSNPDDPFEIIKKKISDEELSKLKDLNMKGIHFLPEIYRYYPADELASQIVGFVGSNGEQTKGIYGIESFWEKELKGEEGSISQERDSRGRWISVSNRDLVPAKNGVNLVLTINHSVQYEVEKILKGTLEKYKADSGSIIVMQPKTGKILALANSPSFNSNNYSTVEDASFFSNSSLSSSYEPGSVFKAMTVAVGIDSGKINPNTTYVDTGSVREAGYEMKNSDLKAYGNQTMTNVLEKSLNTGVIFIEKLVGNNEFKERIKKFGFGEKTEVDLPAEASGNILNIEKTNRNINFFTASFGQGISVTPMQMINAYTALASGGMLMKPQIVDTIIHSDGYQEKINPVEKGRAVSEETAKQMGEMLRSVVINGHGKRADVPGYKVGGKTGTAQVPKIGAAGYEENITIGSFIGYAPIDDPQFVVLVKIDNPKTVQWAESTAAPAFGEVMKFLLEHYGVKPTEELTLSPMYESIYQNVVEEKVISSDEVELTNEKNEDIKKDKKNKDKD